MAVDKASILVVDDEVRVLRMMQRMLGVEGYRVITATNGEAALEVFDVESPDLVFVDTLMPQMSGCEVCRRIREFSELPIIMVTANGNEIEKIEGLDAGADAYITRPFSVRELVARIRASLRRTVLWDEHPTPTFRLDGLVVDFAAHRVTVGGEEKCLTATEYRLLSYLARNAGRIVTSDLILTNVWGEGYCGDIHLLQVVMANLRNKLGDNARNPRYILTRPGVGYMMTEQT